MNSERVHSKLDEIAHVCTRFDLSVHIVHTKVGVHTRGDLKFGKRTLFNAADLASFLTKLGRLSEADAHRVGHARDASESIERS